MNNEARLIVCFALSIVVIFGFSWYNSKKYPQPKIRPTSVTTATATQPESAQTTTPTPTTQAQSATPDPVPAKPEVLGGWNWLPATVPDSEVGKTLVVKSELYEVVFSRVGGVPVSWKLKQYDMLFSDPRYLKLRVEKGSEVEKKVALLELDLLEKYRREGGAHPVDAIDSMLPFGDAGLVIKWGERITDRTVPYRCEDDEVTVSEETTIQFVYENKGIQLKKVFTFRPDTYDVDFRIQINNQSGTDLYFGEEDYFDVLWLGGLGYPSLRDDAANNVHIQLDGSITTTPAASLSTEISRSPTLLRDFQDPTLSILDSNVGWVGVAQMYFLAAIIPNSNTKIALKGLSKNSSAVPHPHVGVRRELEPIRKGFSFDDRYKIYVGPMDEDYLAQVGKGLEDVRQIFLRSFVGPIANLMLKLLKGFHAVIPNYGVSIILLTLLIKILMFPLYHKQMDSMRKMQALQPHINALKEKYKDEPQKMQREQMDLFRKHKVNPLAGCLTMLPTIPIFIALYATFGMSVELRGEPFLWWIQDLSAPDSAFHIPFGAYIFTVNILPLAYTILMYLNMSRQKMEGPNAAMMKILPFVFIFIFWGMASGVILYFVINIFIDLIQRIVTDRMNPVEPIPVGGKK